VPDKASAAGFGGQETIKGHNRAANPFRTGGLAFYSSKCASLQWRVKRTGGFAFYSSSRM